MIPINSTYAPARRDDLYRTYINIPPGEFRQWEYHRPATEVRLNIATPAAARYSVQVRKVASKQHALRIRVPLGYRDSARIDCADLGERCKGQVRRYPVIRVGGICICNEMFLHYRCDKRMIQICCRIGIEYPQGISPNAHSSENNCGSASPSKQAYTADNPRNISNQAQDVTFFKFLVGLVLSSNF